MNIDVINIKKAIIILAAQLSLCCCSVFYSTEMTGVEKDNIISKDIVSSDNNGYSRSRYNDDIIDIVWHVGKSQLDFQLENKTSYSMKLPWDEMSFVSYDGGSHRVIHSGVKYINTDSFQPATIVSKGASLSDCLLPADKIYWDQILDKWNSKTLLPRFSSQKDADNSGIIGKQFSVYFPIIINGVKYEYLFHFRVNDCQVKMKLGKYQSRK